MKITEEIKDTLRENIYEMLNAYISENVPFGLYIWQENDWDKPLPEHVLQEYEGQILYLNITKDVIKNIEINSDGLYRLKYEFDNEIYTKTLIPEYIYSILDNETGVCQVNDFLPPKGIKGIIESYDDIENTLVDVLGIPRENAKKSLQVFKKNNTKGKH